MIEAIKNAMFGTPPTPATPPTEGTPQTPPTPPTPPTPDTPALEKTLGDPNQLAIDAKDLLDATAEPETPEWIAPDQRPGFCE